MSRTLGAPRQGARMPCFLARSSSPAVVPCIRQSSALRRRPGLPYGFILAGTSFSSPLGGTLLLGALRWSVTEENRRQANCTSAMHPAATESAVLLGGIGHFLLSFSWIAAKDGPPGSNTAQLAVFRRPCQCRITPQAASEAGSAGREAIASEKRQVNQRASVARRSLPKVPFCCLLKREAPNSGDL
jgi:hypothetical protein